MADTYTPIGRIRQELRREILTITTDADDYLDDYNLQGAHFRSLIEEHPDHYHRRDEDCADHLALNIDPFCVNRERRPPFAWAGGRRG